MKQLRQTLNKLSKTYIFFFIIILSLTVTKFSYNYYTKLTELNNTLEDTNKEFKPNLEMCTEKAEIYQEKNELLLTKKEDPEFINKICNKENLNLEQNLVDMQTNINTLGPLNDPKDQILVDYSKDLSQVNSNIDLITETIDKLTSSVKEGESSSKFINLDIFSKSYFQLIDNIGSLPVDRQIALINLIMLIIIITYLYSIVSILVTDKAIDYFNVEEKYPRIHTWLKHRKTLLKYGIYWYLFMLTSNLFFLIVFNIYMFIP